MPLTIPQKLKAAIIGLGQVGMRFDDDPYRRESGEVWTHFSAYRKMDDLYDIVAAVDPDPSALEAVQRRDTQIAGFPSVEAMIASLDVDVVSICTPDRFHLNTLEALIGNVRGVFLEKPICCPDETGRLNDVSHALKQARLCIRVNYYKTQEPLFEKALNYLDNQPFRYVSAKYSGPYAAVGSHALNLLTHLCPGLKAVRSFRHRSSEGDAASMFFEFKNQGLAELIYCGPRHELIFELDILGSTRRAILGDNFASLRLFEQRPSLRYQGYRELKFDTEDTHFKNEYRFTSFLSELAHDIRNDCPSYKNWDEAYQTQLFMNSLS
jgi:predicted dehydrogenase